MQWFLTEPEGRKDIMDRMNDRAPAALGPQTRELTESELDAVFGGAVDAFNVANATTIGSATGGAGAGKLTAIIAILIG
jgi:hypothetical protein